MGRGAIFLAAAAFLAGGCGGEGTGSAPDLPAQTEASGPVPETVLARVEGSAITRGEVEALLALPDAGLAPRAALDRLIEHRLLVAEARRRGVDRELEVQDARRSALARAYLERTIGQGVNPGSIDEAKTAKYYELVKERFVHGAQRRVAHILVRGLLDAEAAAHLAGAIALEAGRAKDEDAFLALGRRLVEDLGARIRVERLAPFSADSKKLVGPFVEGAFAVPGVGRTSPPVRTRFGWHVIYVAEDIPAENRPLAEVKEQLAAELVPGLRQIRTKELLDSFVGKRGVTIHEDQLGQGED